MKRTFPSLLCAAAILCAGCKKDEIAEPACNDHCTTISGRFTTDNRTAPIAGLPVQIIWVKWAGAFSAKTRTKAHATTNGQGDYRLNFYLQDDELTDGYFEIVYSADAGKYVVGRDQIGASWLELSRDTTIISNWLLPRKAFVHPVITNAAQIIGDYWGEYSFATGSYQRGSRFTYGVVFTFNHLPVSDIEVAANQPVDLKTYKQVNGQLVTVHDTVRLAPGATYEHRVTY
ncbi:hypothetical protein [Hymenobacter siberiensis]|uniref:hypothetical protein n=1 Tax=Hymenobacter siberiensis TaxID=2848396 RepID=UPI001C1E5FF2|nr:hypothetical protein [Hymenobacter siberiensis]